MSEPNRELFYEHSGRAGLAAPLLLAIGLPVIVLLSAVYSYIVVYCPVVGYVNILFLGGFVFIGGFVLAALAKASKCRSPGLLLILGLVVGIVGLYFAWVFFIKALFGGDVSALAVALNPAGLWRAVVAINADGWWGPSGLAQWALVAIEAVIIVGGIAMFTAVSIDREVFCEDCGTWCEPFETMNLAVTEELMNQKELNHLDLLALEPAEPTDCPRIDAEVLQCSGCQMTQAIRFKTVTQVMEEGQPKEQAEEIPGILIQKKKAGAATT